MVDEVTLQELLRSPLDEPEPPRRWGPFAGAAAVIVALGIVTVAVALFVGGDGEEVPGTAAAATTTLPAGEAGTPATTAPATTATTAPPVTGDEGDGAGESPPLAGPADLDYVAAVFVPGPGVTVVFGGQEPGGFPQTALAMSDQTWQFDGTEGWARFAPEESPPARAGHAMAVDTTRGTVVLFGGGTRPAGFCSALRLCFSEQVGDTWLFAPDAGAWEQVPGGVAPSPRFGHAMAYDAVADRVVLFGGGTGDFRGSGDPLGDTWEFDPETATWIETSPAVAPSPRAFASMAYDPQSGRVLLWGGLDPDGGEPLLWSYDAAGDTWESAPVAGSPEMRWMAAGAFDDRAGRMLVVGGIGKVTRQLGEGITATEIDFFDATLLLDPATGTWSEGASLPWPISGAQAVYDGAGGRTLLFAPGHVLAYDPAADEWQELIGE